MEPFEADPAKLDNGIEIWRDRIDIWFERAAQAYAENHMKVSADALYRRWQYQIALAELEGSDRPEPPRAPAYYFGRRKTCSPNVGRCGPGFGWPGGPDSGAPVPRHPLPEGGSGEIELPLPQPPQIEPGL